MVFGVFFFFAAIVECRQKYIFEGGGARQQVETLKDEADTLVADDGELSFVELADIFPGEEVLPCGGAVEAAEDIHHSAFARTRWPHNGDEFIFTDRQVNAIQRPNLGIAHTINFGDVVRLNDGMWFVHNVYSSLCEMSIRCQVSSVSCVLDT